MRKMAFTYDVEVKEEGRVELNVLLPTGAHVTVFVLAESGERFDDLLSAAQNSLDFWNNPLTGACINPTTPAPSVTLVMGTGSPPTFNVFAKWHGTIPTDLAKNRIFLRFRDSTNIVRGAVWRCVPIAWPMCCV